MIIKKLLTISLLVFGFYTYSLVVAEPVANSSSSSMLSGLASKLGITQDDPNQPLPPDEAFKLSVINVGNQLEASWQVTPGHYLYQDKTKFKIKSPNNVTLGNPIFPKAKTKHDEYLGDTDVYEYDFIVNVPIIGQAGEVTVVTSYQGCSESTGICYPPQHKTHTIKLATANLPESIKAKAEPVAPLALSNNAPLHPDKAFILSIKGTTNNDSKQLIANWKITPGHYLYRNKTSFKIKSPEGVILGEPIFPKGKEKHDEFIGDTEVYEHDFSVTIPVSGQANEVTLVASYQGCSESAGICYPPQHKNHTVKFTAETNHSAPVTTIGSAINNSNSSKNNTEPTISEQDAILNKIKNKSSFGTILMFLLFGLGLALTPCVFPMIPILSGIIAGQGENITTKKAFGLSLSYVIPMALVYAIVGIIAGLGGANIQVMFQNPWIISAFAFVFILLSLSMFGFYELQMPASIQTKLTNFSNKQESGSYIGAGIMGILSALIVGPCVTAPLIAALSYIAQTGDAVLGGLSLFALGMGMGIPLILIGTSAGKLLPKAGAWMDATKAVFGVLMLAMAVWMLSRIVAPQVTMALSAILFIVSGIYLNALEPIHEGKNKWAYLWKGLGFVMLLSGILLFIGAAGGSKSLFQPLAGGVVSSSGIASNNQVEHGLVFERVRSISEFEAVLAKAKSNNQSVMLDFYADWCVSCIEMEHSTFKDLAVINSLKGVILIQADVTANNDDDKALLKKFGLFGPPGILFFTPEGVEKKVYRKVGYIEAERFQSDVTKFLAAE